jgi:hypothetical protein
VNISPVALSGVDGNSPPWGPPETVLEPEAVGMNLLVRRRVMWDYLAGALWVLPTLSVVVFLLAGALLSRVSIGDGSLLRPFAFQGTADDARGLLIVVSSTMITVTGLVFALTIVALQIASGQYSPRLLRNFMRDRGTQLVLSVFVGAFAYSTAGCTPSASSEQASRRSSLGWPSPGRSRSPWPAWACSSTSSTTSPTRSRSTPS